MNNITKLTLALIIFSTSTIATAQFKNTPAQDFTLTDTYGVQSNLFDNLAEDKTVLLFFFSCDCIHCHELAPIADSIYRQFGSGNNQLTVWGIAQYNYNNDDINEFIDSTHITFRCFATGHEDDVFTMYDINYTPQLIMICDYQASESIPQNTIIETLDYCFPTRVDDFQNENLSPIFIDGFLNLSSKKEIQEIYLYDSTGKLIYSSQNWRNNTFIPTATLTKLFILRVIFEDGSTKSMKIQTL